MIILSGCSGGGKSTLLAELARRGFHVIEEPGRRIVDEELARGGTALPWRDMEAFLSRAVAMALTDHASASANADITFFDRGLIDAAVGLEALTGEPAIVRFCETHRYDPQVFLTPPWPEIFANDAARRHDFADAVAEYGRLCSAYPALGYQVAIVPKADVAARADFVVATLGISPLPAS